MKRDTDRYQGIVWLTEFIWLIPQAKFGISSFIGKQAMHQYRYDNLICAKYAESWS